jgi:Protein of unknown function (DUF3237)
MTDMISRDVTMRSLTRRTFAKLSAAAAATAVGPALVGSHLAASATPRDGSPHRDAREHGLREDGLQSEFLVDLTLEAQKPHEVGGAGGGRLVVPVAGGAFEGPRMKGTVIAPSGDWILERPDGSRVLDVRLMLQTDDGQTIYVSWRGIAYPLPDGGLFARILPVFETRAPMYAWLNNVIAVGVYRGLSRKIAYRVYRIL